MNRERIEVVLSVVGLIVLGTAPLRIAFTSTLSVLA